MKRVRGGHSLTVGLRRFRPAGQWFIPRSQPLVIRGVRVAGRIRGFSVDPQEKTPFEDLGDLGLVCRLDDGLSTSQTALSVRKGGGETPAKFVQKVLEFVSFLAVSVCTSGQRDDDDDVRAPRCELREVLEKCWQCLSETPSLALTRARQLAKVKRDFVDDDHGGPRANRFLQGDLARSRPLGIGFR